MYNIPKFNSPYSPNFKIPKVQKSLLKIVERHPGFSNFRSYLYARREFWIPYGPPAAPFEWGGNQDLAEKADLRHPSAATLAPRKLVSLITSR